MINFYIKEKITNKITVFFKINRFVIYFQIINITNYNRLVKC